MSDLSAREDQRIESLVLQVKRRLTEYGPDHSRLLLRIVRDLAQGRPLPEAHVARHIVELGLAPETAHLFLRETTERNAADDIIGAMGLSLGNSPHRFTVAGVTLSAWCALDTLFLPSLLHQTAIIESASPQARNTIRLRVSPERVEEVHPAGAVISLVLLDLKPEHTSSVEAIWNAFCHHIHFFATREEASLWSAGHDDIAIVPVEEGFWVGRQLVSGLFPYLAR